MKIVYSLNLYEKYLSIIIKTLSFIFTIHWISATFYGFCARRYNGLGMCVYLSFPIQLAIVKFLLKKRSENICLILKKLYKYRYLYARGNNEQCITRGNNEQCIRRGNKQDKQVKNQECLLKTFTISLLLIHCVLTLLVYIEDKETENDIWTFGHEIHDKFLLRILSFYISIFYYSFCTIFVLITFSLCIIFYRCSKVLQDYNKLLYFYAKLGKIDEKVKFLKEFFQIVKILKNLNQALSYPSLIIIFVGLEMIFLVFLYLLVHTDMLTDAVNITEVIIYGLYGFFMVIAYSICCSMISEKLLQIRETAKYCLNKNGDNPSISRSVMFYLKRIEKEDIVHITACGMFESHGSLYYLP